MMAIEFEKDDTCDFVVMIDEITNEVVALGNRRIVTTRSAASSSSLVNNNYARARQTKMSASAEDSAKAFTDYMAKSHEEKLKALKDLEDKKNVEIEVCGIELN